MRLVAGVWLVFLVGAFAFVARYGAPTPCMDEWGLVVPLLTGEQAMTPAWLWAHNEHRLPLAKLIEGTLVRAAAGDFRAGMLFNVAALGALALALPVAMARRRGRAVAGDAMFAVLFLGWGQCETLLRGDAVGNVLIATLACVLTVVAASMRGAPSPGAAAAAGTALVLLPPLFWRQAAVSQFQPGVRTARRAVPAAPDGGALTVEIRDTLDELRLDADPRCGALRIEEIALLVAPDSG